MPFKYDLFYENLTKSDKNKLYDIQMRLFDDEFGKDELFVQKVCWKEAVRIFRKAYNTIDTTNIEESSVSIK